MKKENIKITVGAGPVSAHASKARQNKGITLIALIITIIVMLILVSVTINMAINGGLFEKAGEAVGKTENAINKEQELGSGKITIGNISYNSIDEYLKKDEEEGKETIVEEKENLVFNEIGFWRQSGLVSNEDYCFASVLCEPNTVYKCKNKSSWEIVPFAILDMNNNILYCPSASGSVNEIVVEETITTSSEAYRIVFSAPRTDIVWQNGASCTKLTTIIAEDKQDTSLVGIKWGAMGDSFTDAVTLSLQEDTRNYVDLITEQTGIISINYGKSGTGYKRNEDNNIAFYQRALSIDKDINVVTIFGSGNDQKYTTQKEVGNATDTGTETLAGCVNTTIDNLNKVNPNIKIGIITPTPWIGYAPDNTNATWMKRYSAMIVEICNLRNIPCLDLYNESGLEPWKNEVLEKLYIDDTHLNTEGHKIIAQMIKEFLLEIV